MTGMISSLADALEAYGHHAYLITTDGVEPHASRVQVLPHKDGLSFELGRTAARNSIAHSAVSLLWPPIDETGYDLIVNGQVTVDTRGTPDTDKEMAKATLRISKAVLHQPGKPRDPKSPCEADCRRLKFGAAEYSDVYSAAQ